MDVQEMSLLLGKRVALIFLAKRIIWSDTFFNLCQYWEKERPTHSYIYCKALTLNVFPGCRMDHHTFCLARHGRSTSSCPILWGSRRTHGSCTHCCPCAARESTGLKVIVSPHSGVHQHREGVITDLRPVEKIVIGFQNCHMEGGL